MRGKTQEHTPTRKSPAGFEPRWRRLIIEWSREEIPLGNSIMRSFEIIFAMLIIAIGLYGFITSKPSPGDPVNLTFPAIDGSTVDLANLRGKVVLLDFWATWCPPCRGEVPTVVSVYNKYHSRGFEIVGISLDQSRDSLSQFIADNGMTWPEFFDGQGWGNSLARRFDIRFIPQMWLLDRQGRIITKDGRSDLDGQVSALLSTP
jgi:thiol-disulfide isomerase/thioredoxin